MSDEVGYTKSEENRLIRRKHVVGFRVGGSAAELKGFMSRVPGDAVVHSVFYDDSDENSAFVTTIEFYEEIPGDAS